MIDPDDVYGRARRTFQILLLLTAIGVFGAILWLAIATFVAAA
jgi:hypothetical protein